MSDRPNFLEILFEGNTTIFFLFLSRLNVVQKETMWSLILYVVCVCSMCMYVVIFAKLITVSAYIDVFPWDLDKMILG